MSIEQKDSILILGGGLAGSLLACYLSQRGFEVDVFERRGDMRKEEMSAGRSINLALSERGMHALAEVGMLEEVRKIVIPMKGRMMHSIDGKLTFQSYSKDGKCAIYSVSRGELNSKFMTLAEQRKGVKLHFHKRATKVDLSSGTVTLRDEKTGDISRIKGKTILACDGAFSEARSSMVRTPRYDYSQSYLTHGYKEISMPPTGDGKHQMEVNCLHIWPRGSFMMIALPNLDGSFTCTCFFPYEGENGFNRLDNGSDELVLGFFKQFFPDAVEKIPNLLHDFRTNPTSSLVTVKCFPWSIQDKCCLFGDAAHAIVPFFGQGMNAAFEDCSVFNSVMNEFGTDWERVFKKYEMLRKENTDAIADMAIENFIEMRDRVADPNFLFIKQVQHLLGNEFPGRFLSRYELVSFTNIPYKEAQRIGSINDKIIDELIKDADRKIENIDLKKAKELIDKYLPQKINIEDTLYAKL